MKKIMKLTAILLTLALILAGCGTDDSASGTTNNQKENNDNDMSNNRLPEVLAEIPDEYYEHSDNGGTLVNLNYETFESFSYDEQTEVLNKRAVVYLPQGYNENEKYNVLYLMHGGWSDETVYLGSPESGDGLFKNVLDHAIAAGEVEPMIVVSPTYNNTGSEDSGDYNLAIQLTNNYHNELMNDLIPAVAEKFSTFAKEGSYESIVASRNHRGFMGFSMGSVTTWRTFQYDLDAFRYFFPSSGNMGLDGDDLARLVKNQGYGPEDFFIFAASGTDDFAYSSFKAQIDSMASVTDGTFVYADNEDDGNLYFLEKEGAQHDGYAAMTYFYNGVRWLWKNSVSGESGETDKEFSLDTTVAEVIENPAFGAFGRLLFPVDRPINDSSTLREISSSSTYVWYSEIQPNKTVEILNDLKKRAQSGQRIFYSIYSEDEIANDPSKADTGLFYFKGNNDEKFAVMNAGGGFMYVGAMHDSFPHALEASKAGYNAFALIYNPDTPYENLADAIVFIEEHADELEVNPEGYSLWGGSAGARMAATLGNADYLYQLTGRNDIPQAAAVIMQYTGYSYVSSTDAPTYANVGTNDGIANWKTMRNRLNNLDRLGIPTEFHSYNGLSHGFGLGTGTNAEGWIDDAFNFWESNV